MTINERVKAVRKALKLTQIEFGKKVGISQGHLTSIESGKRAVTDKSIIVICATFGVSEEWLRTGNGEMFGAIDEDVELSKAFSAIIASSDELIKRIIKAYWKLDDKEKATIEKLIDGFLTAESNPSSFQQSHFIVLESSEKSETEEFKTKCDPEKAKFLKMASEQYDLEQARESQASSAQKSDAG